MQYLKKIRLAKARDLMVQESAKAYIAADKGLAMCVVETTGWEGLGALMFLGVFAFGWMFRRKRKQT